MLNIRYAGGITASFSLIPYAPREYNYYYFTGTEGRLECDVRFAPTHQAEVGDAGGAEMGLVSRRAPREIRRLYPDGRVEYIDEYMQFGKAIIRIAERLRG